jgi:hypothetical protein
MGCGESLRVCEKVNMLKFIAAIILEEKEADTY